MTDLMRSMSPLMQRLTALLILMLCILLLLQIVFLPLWERASASAAQLEDARFEKARLEAFASRSTPSFKELPSRLLLAAEGTGQDRKSIEQERFAALIQQQSSSYGLTLQSTEPVSGDSNVAALNIIWEGRQDNVIQLIAKLENGSPLMRFQSWQIETLDEASAQIRFSATVIAAVRLK